jgi:hypothetical protein
MEYQVFVVGEQVVGRGSSRIKVTASLPHRPLSGPATVAAASTRTGRGATSLEPGSREASRSALLLYASRSAPDGSPPWKGFRARWP